MLCACRAFLMLQISAAMSHKDLGEIAGFTFPVFAILFTRCELIWRFWLLQERLHRKLDEMTDTDPKYILCVCVYVCMCSCVCVWYVARTQLFDSHAHTHAGCSRYYSRPSHTWLTRFVSTIVALVRYIATTCGISLVFTEGYRDRQEGLELPRKREASPWPWCWRLLHIKTHKHTHTHTHDTHTHTIVLTN